MFKCAGCEAKDKQIIYLQGLIDRMIKKMAPLPEDYEGTESSEDDSPPKEEEVPAGEERYTYGIP